MKKIILLLFICMIVILSLSGCSKKITNQNLSAQEHGESSDFQSKNSIPFNYIFSGFVVVKNINDLPVGIQVINAENDWDNFKEKYLYFDIAYSGYNSGTIDFNKQTVIYYSILSAKPDVYATAYKIDNMLIENKQLKISTKSLEDNYKIIAANKENTAHRYVIVLTVDKKHLPK